MNKAHTNQNWKNKPSLDTPINQTNLNKLDRSVDLIDDRVCSMEDYKANKDVVDTTVKNIIFNRNTGVFTVTKVNGVSYDIDTDIEKIAINFDYDENPLSPHYQCLILTLIDGTVKYIDMSALITQYEFVDSAQIHFSVDSSGKVTATIIAGSITEDMLQPNFLADCRLEVNKATQQANLSNDYRKRSEAYAVGTIDGSPVPDTDECYENNSKWWANKSKDYSDESKVYSENAEDSAQYAEDMKDTVIDALSMVTFSVNFETGNIEYDNPGSLYTFTVNETTGNLEWEVAS